MYELNIFGFYSTNLDELSEEGIKSQTNKHHGVLDCVRPSLIRIFITKNTEGVSKDNSKQGHHRTLKKVLLKFCHFKNRKVNFTIKLEARTPMKM